MIVTCDVNPGDFVTPDNFGSEIPMWKTPKLYWSHMTEAESTGILHPKHVGLIVCSIFRPDGHDIFYVVCSTGMGWTSGARLRLVQCDA